MRVFKAPKKERGRFLSRWLGSLRRSRAAFRRVDSPARGVKRQRALQEGVILQIRPPWVNRRLALNAQLASFFAPRAAFSRSRPSFFALSFLVERISPLFKARKPLRPNPRRFSALRPMPSLHAARLFLSRLVRGHQALGDRQGLRHALRPIG